MGYPLTLLLLHLFIIVFCHDAFLRFLRTCGIFVEYPTFKVASAIHRGINKWLKYTSNLLDTYFLFYPQLLVEFSRLHNQVLFLLTYLSLFFLAISFTWYFFNVSSQHICNKQRISGFKIFTNIPVYIHACF